MRIKIISVVIFALLFSSTVSCSDNNKQDKVISNKSIELYLPQLKTDYSSVYEHWEELELNKITLMEKPLLEAKDIESFSDKDIKIKKKMVIVKGEGTDPGNTNSNDIALKFKYKGKTYSVRGNSPELFYNYSIHGVCVVIDNENIFFVRYRDFDMVNSMRRYSKGPVGIPYVLVIDGVRSKPGIIKVGEGNFAVPENVDSWCYMGFPGNLPELIPDGKTFKQAEAKVKNGDSYELKLE
jgi:hypothetical protein